ncbi:MAG TPA: XRE family transcriptional regulator [Bacteroidales bacterium]|nr:XRE family transcriptional regulator [Bacteroidales bacterium]
MSTQREIFSKNLKKLIEKRGIDQRILADYLGTSEMSVSNWVNGNKYPRIGNIQKIADYFGVKKSDLIEDKSNEKVVTISKYNYYPVSISAGLPINVDGITNDDVEQISIPDSVMRNHAGSKDVFFMKTNGESMNNVIPHDSLIAVKHTNISNLSDGDIVVYSCDHEYAVKRFYNDKSNKRFIFKPDSTDLRFIDNVVTYEESKNLKLYGKVVLYIVNLD